jgi:hypothetical protein
MEDKLLNKIISQHMKHYVVSNNAIKHKTNTNDHKTNITTSSISRETSETLLKNKTLVTPTISTHKKSITKKITKISSKSSDRIDKNKIKDKSREKIIIIKKNSYLGANKSIKTGSIQPKFKKSEARQLNQDSIQKDKSFFSKVSSKNSSVLNKSRSTGLEKKDSSILAHKTNYTNKKSSCKSKNFCNYLVEISPEKSLHLLNEVTSDIIVNTTQVK